MFALWMIEKFKRPSSLGVSLREERFETSKKRRNT